MSKIIHFRDTTNIIKHIDDLALKKNCCRSVLIREALKDLLVKEYGEGIKHYMQSKKRKKR